jgi:hypothetical protein
MASFDDDVKVDLGGLDAWEERLTAAQLAQLRRCTLDLMGEAINEAPVREGQLRGSAAAHFGGAQIATGPAAAGATPLAGGAGTGEESASVTFNTVYAVAQHEGTDFNHPLGGKAKYLQDPFERNYDLYVRLIADAGRGVTEGGGR